MLPRIQHYRRLNHRHFNKTIQISNFQNNQVVSVVQKERERQLKSKTGTFWLQYMEMVSLMRTFIKAERTGDWRLHLISLKRMLPFLAATGHNNYLKSIRIYLQNMYRLKDTHPNIENSFLNGNHVIRRSERYWAGLSADLIIEQEYMRSVKSTGDL